MQRIISSSHGWKMADGSWQMEEVLHETRFPAQDEGVLVRSCEKSKVIGSSGGTIALAGFRLQVLPLTLQTERRLKMTLKFYKNASFIGAEVDLEPNGTSFSADALLTIPTCYEPKRYQSMMSPTFTVIQKRHGTWIYIGDVSCPYENINFQQLWPLRILANKEDYYKTISHMLYTRQEGEDEYKVIWYFYDNLVESRLEVEKEMELRHFTLTGMPENFQIRCKDGHVSIALEIPGCNIEDHKGTILARDLWASEAFIKMEFNIKNLGVRFNIKDMIRKVEHKVES